MRLDAAVDRLLSPYTSRVQVRAGNGLTKSMNSTLRSYPDIPRIIRRTITLLASIEILFGLSGTVAIKWSDLYELLIDTHEDWYRELPHIDKSVARSISSRLPGPSPGAFGCSKDVARSGSTATSWVICDAGMTRYDLV